MTGLTAYGITFLAALAGSGLAKRLKIPAAAMTGAILAAAALNCLTGRAAVPALTKPCMQIMGGALLGHRIGRGDLQKMRSIVKAALVLILGMLLLNVTTGLGVLRLTELNPATAFLATAPGGVSDMALIAEDLGADMQVVSILQLFRMFGIYLIFPPVLRLVQKGQKAVKAPGPEERESGGAAEGKRGVYCAVTLLAAFGGGYLMNLAGMPAGFMVGSVAACAALNIRKGCGYIPEKWRFYIQSVTGAVIGCQMTREGLFLLKRLALPVVCMICGMLLFTFLFGWIMSRVSALDFQTSLLCLTPGGIQETSLLASDMGCDVSSVVVMHTVRLVVVICFFPMLLTVAAGS
ncbi:MAG: AbrB family transcriptional regulator [Roseburia sp.]|nr:AbrB family transcriptional regulator [Roseburia sp.]MCM1096648.1 AbrB family transcriptional regulator [Ruminococcus flavefaciens]